MSAPYSDAPLGRFAELVAAREAAPGGGAVAAVTVSLAAALAAMAARYAEDDVVAAHHVDESERLLQRALALADEDARAYRAVIAARGSTRDTEPAQRREEIRASLHRATVVPLQVAQLAAETATLAARLVNDGNRTVQGDAVTAVLLAEAATRAAAHLVAVNVDASGVDNELLHQAERSVEIAYAAASGFSAHLDRKLTGGRHPR